MQQHRSSETLLSPRLGHSEKIRLLRGFFMTYARLHSTSRWSWKPRRLVPLGQHWVMEWQGMCPAINYRRNAPLILGVNVGAGTCRMMITGMFRKFDRWLLSTTLKRDYQKNRPGLAPCGRLAGTISSSGPAGVICQLPTRQGDDGGEETGLA